MAKKVLKQTLVVSVEWLEAWCKEREEKYCYGLVIGGSEYVKIDELLSAVRKEAKK